MSASIATCASAGKGKAVSADPLRACAGPVARCIRLPRGEAMADEKEAAPEPGRRLHVTVLLVASRRALDNALGELGFAEDDDRIIEHDGRLAFLTCTHEDDCDDLFALITELSARGESWELQSRIDTEAGRAVYQ